MYPRAVQAPADCAPAATLAPRGAAPAGARRLVSSVASIALAFSVATAHALPVFTAAANDHLGNADAQSGPSGVSAAAGTGGTAASAGAGRTGIGVLAVASSTAQAGAGCPGAGSMARASARFSDVLISYSPGGPSTVAGSLNLHLSGDVAGFVRAAQGGSAAINSHLDLTVSVAGQRFVGSRDVCMLDNYPGLCIAQGTAGLGILAGYTGNNILQLSHSALPVNQAFEIVLELLAHAAAVADSTLATGVSSAVANADFAHTLTFVQSGPVFTLPAGYSVDSSDAGIVDSRYIFVAAVPQPAAHTLLLLAIAVLALLAKPARRKTRGG